MFWKKKSSDETQIAEKLPGPKEIPELVGRHLVVELKQDPDWVWNLKAVMRGKPEGKNVFDFRVFAEADASSRKIKVRDYNHLAEFPDLILYAGWFDKKALRVQIELNNKKN